MNNKIVLISGASRGIGLSIAIHLANIGFKVIGIARNEFKFDSTLENLIPLKLDITCRESIKVAAISLKEQNLLPDVLINNAGITSDQIFLRMKDEDWDNVLSTNLTGTFNLTKAFIKNMIKKGLKSIILDPVGEILYKSSNNQQHTTIVQATDMNTPMPLLSVLMLINNNSTKGSGLISNIEESDLM